MHKWTKVGGKRHKGLVNRRAAEAELWAQSTYVSPNYQTVESQGVTGICKLEALAPIIGSFSGLGELFAGNGPVQWALAGIMVLAACTAWCILLNAFRSIVYDFMDKKYFMITVTVLAAFFVALMRAFFLGKKIE
ncbi:lysozyme family protein [Bartonella callosciuri]|uniref:Lysozyme family protein n=1 Tax=Bartonella callosciuri TaxID=686223 RepID=A0A840NQU4_9HYPH|nr:lysozyme family protein [Bartonella callosciuri]